MPSTHYTAQDEQSHMPVSSCKWVPKSMSYNQDSSTALKLYRSVALSAFTFKKQRDDGRTESY